MSQDNIIVIDALTKELEQYNCTGVYRVEGGVEFVYVENGEVIVKRYTNKKGAVA